MVVVGPGRRGPDDDRVSRGDGRADDVALELPGAGAGDRPASIALTVQPVAFGRLDERATCDPTQLPAG